MGNIIGKPIDRKDGKLKVTGSATYAAEFPVKNLTYAVTVQSSVTKGRIVGIDDSEAKALKGVLGVMTSNNAMRLKPLTPGIPGIGKFAEKELPPLQNEEIFYNGQNIAVVIAETLETATHAARLLKVTYSEEKAIHRMDQPGAVIYQPKPQGQDSSKPARGEGSVNLKQSSNFIEETYSTPVYHHNPIEPHATTAIWNGDELTVYDSTQTVFGNHVTIATFLGIPKEKVRLISPFIGGGFGSKGFMWSNSILAPMAAKLVNRPVKLVLERTGQMFTNAGRRSFTIQKLSIGTDPSGKFTSMSHETTCETSFVDEFIESAGNCTKMLYDSPNLDIKQNVVRLNKGTPCPTRAPGEAPGTYALEVAVDEMAYKLGIDPLELRMINYAEKNPTDGHEWSSKNLKECYKSGAEAIGWKSRNIKPGTTMEEGMLVGYGMATATYPANRSKASVGMKLYQDGHAVAACCTQDIGTGTYTVMAQVMADALGLPIDKVEFKLGDTIYPQGPNSGGSQTMATTGPAVHAAALTIKSKIMKMAAEDRKSPLFGVNIDDMDVKDGSLFFKNDASRSESYAQIMKRNRKDVIETEITTNVTTRPGASPAPPAPGGPKDESKGNVFVMNDEQKDRKPFSFHSFGAHFVKCHVDPILGTVKVKNIVSIMDIGTILNEKTARSQIIGGAVWGIGMALMEASEYDPNTGRIVTRDLSEYLVPVHADMPEFDIRFTNIHDGNISPVGARGAGEIGITGVTAAIANAVFHATGKRVRDLPITPDKLI